MSNLDELRALNNRLTELLNDAQPGLITWRDALNNVLKKIGEFKG